MLKRITLFLLLNALLFSANAQSRSAIQGVIDEVNIDSLLYFVQELSGEVSTTIGGSPYTITSRHKNSDGNVKAAIYLKQKLESYGLTPFYNDFGSLGRNVIAEQTGTEFPNRKYIICGHYDDMPSSGLAPGADDNASGTAGVIEAARVLSGYSFPYTLVYALWDEEEQGLVGAHFYADQATAAGDTILGVINMDMIAWDNNSDNVVRVHVRDVADSYSLSNKMLELNISFNIGLDTRIVDPGTGQSDHAAFWSEGYSALLLIEDDVSDFNNYYHSSNDLISHFNTAFFHRCAKLAIATVTSFAMNLNLAIEHTPFASIDYSADVQLSANIVTGLEIATGDGAPRLYYRVDTGSGYSSYFEVVGTPTALDASGVYNFIIPAQQLGTKVQYYLAAQDADTALVVTLPMGGQGFNPPGNVPPPTVYEFFVSPIEMLFVDNASNLDNWQASGAWNITTSKYVSAPSSFTDSPSGNYLSNVTSNITMTNFINLTDALGVGLSFKTQWDIESNYDYAQVQISTDGTTWTPLEGMYTEPGQGTFQPTGEPVYDGTQLTWVQEEIDLSAYVGQQIKLRFFFKSDGSVTDDGIYVDDVEIIKYGIVPVELTSFTYQMNSGSVVLNWSTATELNNHGFEVQRSFNNESWQSIAFVDGHGTSSNTHNYSVTDKPEKIGHILYRLKQIDYDGTLKIYGPVEVDFVGSFDYALDQNYPNPFNPTTTIQFSIPQEENVKLFITNSLGQVVAELVNKKLEAGRHKVEFEAGDYSSGVYFYRLETGQFVNTKKMILLK